MTLGALSYGYPTGSVIDLSGATPLKTDFTTPIVYLSAYAANSASQWLVGNTYGIVLDGPSVATLPRYFTVGAAFSIAAGTNRVAIATANGVITYFNPATATQEGSIDFPAAKLALSSSGTVLAASYVTFSAQYQPDSTLKLFSLPAGTTTASFPYQYPSNGGASLFDFSLANSGTILGRFTGTENNGSTTYQRLVTDTTGATIIRDDTAGGIDDPILLSPDGTLIAVSNAPPTLASTTNIYKNGTLTTTVSGFPVGWIDDDHLSVDQYVQTGHPPSQIYSGTTIYNAAGMPLSTPALPELRSFQTVTANSIYSLV